MPPAPLDVAGESASTVEDAPADVSITPPVAVRATPAIGAVTAAVPRSAAEPLGPSASTVAALAVDAGDTLTVVAVVGAEAVGVDGDVMFTRDGEAPLWYRDLHVFDA